MINKIYLLILIIGSAFSANAQDTLSVQENADTVIIYKEPVIVRKTIIRTKKINYKWMADVFINTSYSFNEYSYCDCYPSFSPVYKSSLRNALSYGLGGNLSRKFNKILLTGSLQFLSIRDQLKYTGSTSNNSYNYINTSLLVGYILGKEKFTIVPSAGLVLSTFLWGSGKTISPTDLSWQGLNASQQYYRNTIDLTARLKLLYKFRKDRAFFIEPYVLRDMQNITKSPAPFDLRRTVTGINLGITFFLK